MSKIAKILQRENDFVVSCHVQPDGDGLGSILAIARYLSDHGKRFVATLPDMSAFPSQYAFLPGKEMMKAYEGEACRVFIALDCASRERLGALAEVAAKAEFCLNIDHHKGNKSFGTINLVDEGACATVLLTYNILAATGWDMPPEAAECLYVGLVTDTGRFQYSNTDGSAFALAAELVKKGVVPNKIFELLYEQTPLASIRLLGRGLSKLVVVPQLGFAYSILEKKDFQEMGAVGPDADMIVEHLRSLDMVGIVALIKEVKEGNVKVSLRSKGSNDVARIAAKFGGGGHLNAAGFVEQGPIAGVVRRLTEVVREYREQT